jgi:hypothetical protein
MRVRSFAFVIALFALCIVMAASAEIPGQISFQGKLASPEGAPIRDSLYQVTFRIFNAPIGGAELWQESDTMTTRAGLFQTILGGVNPIPLGVFSDTNAYLSIEFAGNELQPRKAFRSVGYAYHAAVADAAPPIPDADWTIDGDNIYRVSGEVGIGTQTPEAKLDVRGGPILAGYTGGNLRLKGGSIDAGLWTGGENRLLIADWDTGTRGLMIDLGSGNIGMGTASPAFRLDVNGDIRSTGNIYGNVSYSSTAGNSDMVDGVHNGALSADIWDGHHWGDTYPYSSNSDMVDGIHGGSFLRNDQSGTLDGTLQVTGNIGVGRTPDARISVETSSGSAATLRNNSTSVALWVSNNSTGTAISCGNQTSGADYVLKVIGYNNATTSNGMWVKGRTQIHGDFSASDGTKSAVVPSSQGPIRLYSQESPEVWFEDFGEGRLINGQCQIALDPLFLETVTIDEQHPMKVFIQPNDNCNGVFVQRGINSFTVIELQNGQSAAAFTYRLVAKRKGYENSRLEHEPEWNQ